MTDLYNSGLAIATRITIILNARPHIARTSRALAAIDMLTTNAAEFDLYPLNLHGDTVYIATEFAARTTHIDKGIKFAVTRGLIIADKDSTGMRFTISETGNEFVSQLSSQYVHDYQRVLNSALAYVDSRPLRQVRRRIEHQGIETIEEERP